MAQKAYHHGDLRNALVLAAAALAEEGGPEAVTIRAAARAVDVTPTATYRHFADRDELLDAARQECLDRMAARFVARIADVAGDLPPGCRAVEQFMASGRAYVDFAVAEEGLFRTCMCAGDDQTEPSDTAPYALLTHLLDELVVTGAMDPAERPLAEVSAWATVHGLALLLIDGPLRSLSESERVEVIDRTVHRVARGLGADPGV